MLCIRFYPPELKIVTIGDSTSNGYYLNDYGSRSGATWGWGNGSDNYGAYDQASKSSFSFLLKDYLQKYFGDSRKVDLTNLTFEGMRADELRATLDPSYIEKAAAKGDYFCTNHMENYNYWYEDNYQDIYDRGFTKVDINDIGDKPIFTAVFEDAISDADLIVLDFVMNSFGTYFSSRLQGIFGMEDKSLYSEPVESLADEMLVPIPEIEMLITSMLNKFLPEDLSVLSEVIDLFTYCYCDLRVNFAKDIELIRNLNKNAKIVVVSPFNSMDGLVVSIGGIEVDLGALWGCYMSLVNKYITSECLLRGTYSFANCLGTVETFVGGLRNTASIQDIYPRYGELLLSDLAPDCTVSDDEVLGAILNAAHMKSYDVVGALGIMNSGTDVRDAAVYAASNWDEASEAERTLLYVYCNFFTAHGMGSHPSENGCYQKFAAIKCALGKPMTLISDAIGSSVDFGSNIGKALLKFNNSLFVTIITAIRQTLVNLFTGK